MWFKMNLKGIKLIVVFVIGIGLNESQAQSMHVKEIAGPQIAYSLNNISKLSFSSGELTISQFDNTIEVYSISSLRHLRFSDSTSVKIEEEKVVNHGIRIFPNPVNNVLKIDLSNVDNPNGTVKILSLQGRLLKTQQISGSAITSIDMSDLPRGSYICHCSSETEMNATLIIKQ